MARISTQYMMEEYIDDFGNKYRNIPFKIQPNAPKVGAEEMPYVERPDSLSCGGGIPFTTRRLLVTFNDGRKLTYPVPKLSDLLIMIRQLKPSLVDKDIIGIGGDEAACIDLIGEKWNLVPPSVLGASLSFKTTPYIDIPIRGTKETGTYSYKSDFPSLGKIQLGYRIENQQAMLLKCQKEGMAEISTAKGICQGKALGVKPRHFIINAIAQTGNDAVLIPDNLEVGITYSKVIRNVIVSGYDPNILPGAKTPVEVAKVIDKCAYCLGWEGESIKGIHNLVTSSNLLG